LTLALALALTARGLLLLGNCADIDDDIPTSLGVPSLLAESVSAVERWNDRTVGQSMLRLRLDARGSGGYEWNPGQGIVMVASRMAKIARRRMNVGYPVRNART
jgi:hypothetical protein